MLNKKYTCYDELVKSYKKYGNRTALSYYNNKISLKGLLKEIDVFSEVLVSRGIGQGDVFTIYMPNCPQAIVAFYALSKIGATAQIVHPLVPEERLFELISEYKSKGLLCLNLLVKNKKLYQNENLFILISSPFDYFRAGKFILSIYEYFKAKKARGEGIKNFKSVMAKQRKAASIEVPRGRGRDVVALMHSGGTGGKEKCVQLTNENFNYLCHALDDFYEKGKRSEYAILALPIFHAFGLAVAVHVFMWHGVGLVLFPKFNAKKVAESMKIHNVTVIAGVPLMFKKLFEHKKFAGKHLANLKACFCGGDELSEGFVERFDELLIKYGAKARLLRGYGLTEVAGVCSVNTIENYQKNSCGKPLPGTKIEIWDKNNKVMPPNTVGQIIVSNPAVMKGYAHSKNKGILIKEGEKYILTGDVGYIDENGYLFILGREKRMIKIAGVNVFPSEIENLVKTLPFIDEVCAVDKLKNGKPVIELFYSIKLDKASVQGSNKVNYKNEIKKLCDNKLIKYSRPTIYTELDCLPHTKIAKIDYRKLKYSL